jgi:hypothetical protein
MFAKYSLWPYTCSLPTMSIVKCWHCRQVLHCRTCDRVINVPEISRYPVEEQALRNAARLFGEEAERLRAAKLRTYERREVELEVRSLLLGQRRLLGLAREVGRGKAPARWW